jgi:2-C-methyl-D-erythritol 4-phosphate cytidylyltransferase
VVVFRRECLRAAAAPRFEVVRTCMGGRRADSVRAGLNDRAARVVVVHDGARPAHAGPDAAGLEAAGNGRRRSGAAAVETSEADADGLVRRTATREGCVQTPQIFRYEPCSARTAPRWRT